jgi:protein-disulfide isomerase
MFRNLFPSLILLAVVVGGSFLWVNSQNSSSRNVAAVDNLVSIVDTAADDADSKAVKEMTLGAEDAKVTIVEYASFTCPHCANFHKTVFQQLKTNYVDSGKVRFVMRDVYFDQYGLWASMLARCDGGDKYFGLSAMIYSRQKEWIGNGEPAVIADNLRKLGKLAGMEDATMDACLQDQEMAKSLVAAYRENATRDEINATPSFIINGKKYSNMTYDDFAATIDKLLAE